MSLKAFHLIFIIASTTLAFGVGGWVLSLYVNGTGGLMELTFAIASFISGVALLWYGKYFLKKLKHIDYI